MHLSTATTTVVLLALGLNASAMPSPKVVEQPQPGEKACCVQSSSISEGTNLLTRGLISNLLGASDQACATTSVIETLNLLGFSEHKDGNHSCLGTPARCHEGRVSFLLFFPFLLSFSLIWLLC